MAKIARSSASDELEHSFISITAQMLVCAMCWYISSTFFFESDATRRDRERASKSKKNFVWHLRRGVICFGKRCGIASIHILNLCVSFVYKMPMKKKRRLRSIRFSGRLPPTHLFAFTFWLREAYCRNSSRTHSSYIHTYACTSSLVGVDVELEWLVLCVYVCVNDLWPLICREINYFTPFAFVEMAKS